MIGSMKVSDNGNKVIINGLEYNKTIHFQSSIISVEKSTPPYKVASGSAVVLNDEIRLFKNYNHWTENKSYMEV